MLTEQQLSEFEETLQAQRQRIVERARAALVKRREGGEPEEPDEMDRASEATELALSERLEGRERRLLRKINEALQRIRDGEFGLCEICEEPIGLARLRARPVTSLCIDCKEDQEQVERTFARSSKPRRKRGWDEEETPKQRQKKSRRPRRSADPWDWADSGDAGGSIERHFDDPDADDDY